MQSYFKLLNGYKTVYTNFSGGVYEMDLTRACINSFATHCSKLKPEVTGSALQRLKTVVEERPNAFMDTAKFIKRIATIYETDHNVFIVPIEDKRTKELLGYYPIRPSQTELVEANGTLYMRYTFSSGVKAAIEFERVGVLTDFQYKDDMFGEDNTTLYPTMQLMHTQNEGIINAVKNSANVRFLAKVANMLKPEDIKKERDRFAADNLSADNESGMIIYDTKFEDVKPIDSKPYTVNAAQMQMINENAFMHFGTNMKILTNAYTEEDWNAYYEGKIEPFAIQLSLVMTHMSVTEKQLAYGNKIFYSSNRLQYASNATKLQVSTQLFDRGLLNRNGVMDIWNMPHVEGGEKYYIRREYAEIDKLEDKTVTTEEIQEGENENA